MSALEQELMQKISRLSDDQQRRVLEFVQSIEKQPQETLYTALELIKLPYEERNRLVIAALESSADEEFEIFETE
jgi:hypothetical protein